MINIKLFCSLALFASITQAVPVKILYFYSENTTQFVLNENVDGMLDAFKKYSVLLEDDCAHLSINKQAKTDMVEFYYVKIAKHSLDNEVLTNVENIKPQIIVVSDELSLKTISAKYSNTQYPIVFFGVNEQEVKHLPEKSINSSSNLVGMVDGNIAHKSIEMLNQLAPNIKNFMIVGDDGEVSHKLHAEFSNCFGAKEYNLIATILNNDFNIIRHDLLQTLKTKKVDGIIILSLQNLSDGENIVPYFKFLEWYNDHVVLPEIAVDKIYVNRGALCNVHFSNYEQGVWAGEKIAKMIINNNFLPKNIIHYDQNPRELINLQRAKKLNITQIQETENRYFLKK